MHYRNRETRTRWRENSVTGKSDIMIWIERFVNIYEYLWTFMNICEDLWTFVKIYEHLWRFMNICEDLWTFVKIYEHLWRFINICENFINGLPWVPGKREYPHNIVFIYENVCCRYSSEAPQWGIFNEYPLHRFFWRNKKNKQLTRYLRHW